MGLDKGGIFLITGVFGLTGAGKSTLLAWASSRALSDKPLHIGLGFAGGVSLQDCTRYPRGVYSNFPLAGCYKLNFEQLGKFDFRECLLLIDEIMMLCDSRNWKNYPENIKYFMSHHRHYNTDIIWCSQSYTDTDIRIRALSQQFLYIQKMGDYTTVTPIRHLMDVKNGSISDWYELGGIASKKIIKRKKYYRLFDSHSKKELQIREPELWEL